MDEGRARLLTLYTVGRMLNHFSVSSSQTSTESQVLPEYRFLHRGQRINPQDADV